MTKRNEYTAKVWLAALCFGVWHMNVFAGAALGFALLILTPRSNYTSIPVDDEEFLSG